MEFGIIGIQAKLNEVLNRKVNKDKNTAVGTDQY
jgi:hypothetical protein